MSAPAPPPGPGLRLARLVLPMLAAIALLAGCGSDKHMAPIVKGPVLPPGTPHAVAPDSTALRWFTAYAARVEGEADTLLSADFHYRFSAAIDPDLVTRFGDTGWGKASEATSLHHLVHGFTNDHGQYLSPASAMTVSALAPSVGPDTSHADSTAWYKRVTVLRLDVVIDIPDPSGAIEYNVQAVLELLLVRGDAAVLGPGQEASAGRWYVRECDDLTAPLYAGWKRSHTDMPLPANVTSWGTVRAAYLQ